MRRNTISIDFEAAFEAMPGNSALLGIDDPVFTILATTSDYLTSLGKTKEDTVGKGLFEAFPKSSSNPEFTGKKNLKASFQKVIATKQRDQLPAQRYDVPNKDGEGLREYYWQATNTPVFDNNDNVIAIIHTAEDVTELMQSRDQTEKIKELEQTNKLLTQAPQTKVEDNEKRYRTLIEEATVATALYIGRELRIQYVNELMTAYWGKDHSVIGKTLLEAVPEIKGQTFPELLDKVYTTGETYTGIEVEAFLKVSGELQPYYFNFTYKALRNEQGEIYGIHHMAIDVTEQVVARKKTEESERRYREISQSLEQKVQERTFTISQLNETYKYAEQTGNFGSYRYNFTTGELIYSDNLYRLLGCKPGEFVPSAENFLKYIHPEDREYVEAVAAKVFEKHIVSKNEYRIIRKDGKMIHLRGTANIVRVGHGKKYMIGTLQDITDEKNKEQLLNEKNESLIKMNKELESFAYISSHDLQEPLRKIQTFASRVIDSEYHKLSDNAKGFFERMQHAALRMQTLIDDLLAYSRTNSEDRKYETVHLGEIVEEIREEIHEDLEVYHATIEAEDLCEVNIIPFQFRQLMHNLIGNALKFSRHERAPHIIIKSENDTGEAFEIDKLEPNKYYCHISIADNGIGFDPEYGEKIFEVFQRLHSRDRYKGTGIGLAIVKKIVENHHGIITATGEVNKGATFDIYLPAAKNNLQK